MNTEDSPHSDRADGSGPQESEYPVREYIGSMAQELSQMARWAGDDELAELLEAAALKAEEAQP